MGKVVGLVVFTVVSAGFVGLGVLMLRHLDSATSWLQEMGRATFGRLAGPFYQRRGVRIAAVGCVVVGSMFVVIGLAQLVGTLLRLSAS